MSRLRILLSLMTTENYYQQQHASAAQEVAQRLDVDLQIVYADNDPLRQRDQLLQVIHGTDTRPDGIICAPVGTTMAQVARPAVGAGIGWAVLNRECDYMADLRQNSDSVPVFSVGPDQSEIGRIQGRQISALLPDGGLVLYILGSSTNPIVEYRRLMMLSAKPASVQVMTLSGNWSEQSGYKAISAWLRLSTSHITPVNLVAAQCDDMALGARKAFQDNTQGKEREQWLKLPFIGVDGCPGAGQKWVRNGLLTATVVNPPTAGRALETMVRAIRSRSKPAEYTLVAPASLPGVECLESAPWQAPQFSEI